MYKISSSVLSLFKNYCRQSILIKMTTSDTSLTITEKDVVQNTFTVNRYSISGSKIEVGSAAAAELSFSLNNSDGRFDSVKFEGANLFVSVGVSEDWNADNPIISYVPLGYFRIDKPPRKKTIIEITALDYMRRFDQLVDATLFTDGLTIGRYIQIACDVCGVTLATSLSSLPNYTYTITKVPDNFEDKTYRQIIQWCAAVMGTCAFIDWNGHLCFSWYGDSSCITITSSDRYTGADIYENDIVITGVSASVDTETYLYGTDDYTIDIVDNPLLQNDVESVLENIGSVIIGFTYRPFSCEAKPLPHIYPLDLITITDSNGNQLPSIVSNITFCVNKHTSISGQGETSEEDDYYIPLVTQNEQLILDKIRAKQTEMSKILTDQANLLIQMNNTLNNGLGLYKTTITDATGAVKYYFSDAKNLADSNIIYTFDSGGFMWTDDWNDGSPVWVYGFDSNGDSFWNYLAAHQISANYIDVQSLVASGEFVAKSEDGSVLLSITNDGIYINSQNFKLMTDGTITATGGTIAGFTINETCLTNSDGSSYIEISDSSGNYKTQLKSGSVGVMNSTTSSSGTTYTSGAYLGKNGLTVTYQTSANNSNLYIYSYYQKRTNTTSYDGKNTTVYEGCITTKYGSYNVDSASETATGSFILGCARTVNKSPYGGVYEWGAYLRFDNYQNAYLCYDSSLSGAWKMKDVYTGNEYGISVPHIESSGTTTLYWRTGAHYNYYSSDGTVYHDGSYYCTYTVVACGELKLIFLEYIGSSDGEIAEDNWYYVQISALTTITKALGVSVVSAASSMTDLSGNKRSNEFVTLLNENWVHFGMDDNTARGFRAVVFCI